MGINAEHYRVDCSHHCLDDPGTVTVSYKYMHISLRVHSLPCCMDRSSSPRLSRCTTNWEGSRIRNENNGQMIPNFSVSGGPV